MEKGNNKRTEIEGMRSKTRDSWAIKLKEEEEEKENNKRVGFTCKIKLTFPSHKQIVLALLMWVTCLTFIVVKEDTLL